MPADHGELDTAKIVYGELFEAGGDRSGLLKPADTTLNDVAAAVWRSNLGGRPRRCALWSRRSCGSDGANMVLMEPVADASVAVTSVAPKPFGMPPWGAMWLHDSDGIEHRLGKERLVSLAGTQRSEAARLRRSPDAASCPSTRDYGPARGPSAPSGEDFSASATALCAYIRAVDTPQRPVDRAKGCQSRCGTASR